MALRTKFPEETSTIGAGSPSTDDTSLVQANRVTAHAGECLVCGWCVGSLFCRLLGFTSMLTYAFEGGGDMVDRCLFCPLMVVGVASGEEMFKTFCLFSMTPLCRCGQFSV